jgi:hypothetical protein
VIRIVVLVAAIFAIWLGLRQVAEMLKRRHVDWKGIAFAAGFVVLAFWLRGATGIG